MLEFTISKGANKAKILLYTLSTCVWCAKTKSFLDELGVSYAYVDVDLLSGADREEAIAEVQRWNPQMSFPTIVINETRCISGYDPEELSEAIG